MSDDQTPVPQPLPPIGEISHPSPSLKPLKNATLWWWALMIVLLTYLVFRRRHADWINSINIAVLVFSVLAFISVLRSRTVVRRTAKKILHIRKHTYGLPPQCVQVDIAEIPGIDVEFFERARADAEHLGFQFVGDQETAHMTKALSVTTGERIVLRKFLGGSGVICLGVSKSTQGEFFGLTTELTDGRFVETSNTLGARASPVPGIIMNRQPRDTSLGQLLDLHRNTLDSITDAKPIGMSGLEEAMASYDREHAKAAAFKWRPDFDEAAELRLIHGRELNKVEKLIAQEIAHLKLKEFLKTQPK